MVGNNFVRNLPTKTALISERIPMPRLMLAILVDDESPNRFNEKGGYNSEDILDRLSQIPDFKVVMMWAVNPNKELIDLKLVEDWPMEIEEHGNV